MLGHIGLKNPPIKGSYNFYNQNVKEKLNYVALGDSLTSGMGLKNYEESFPYLLTKDFFSKNINIDLQNFSYPGYRTDDLIKNLLEPAIAAKPQIVTLLIGVNDIHGFYSKDKFKKNYQYILERLTKETEAKIYAISLPFIGDNVFLPPFNYYSDYQTEEFNKIIRESTDQYSIKYIDIAEPTKALFFHDKSYYVADEFHPSALGHALWEKIIFAEISKDFNLL